MGAESVPDPLGGSLLFYVLNNTPTIAVVTSNGIVGTSGSVPAIAGLNNSGTAGHIAFLSAGGAVVTWTLSTYGSSYMAYRSPTGAWGSPVQLPSGFSNLAVRSGEVLTAEGSGTGISTESWTLSGTGGLTLATGPTNVYVGQPLFNTSWLALDPAGTAELVVYGSTDNGNSETVAAATRSATGQWSAQSQLSASGQYVSSVVFATAPGGRSIVNWVTGATPFAANSYTAVRPSGQALGVAVGTGSVSSANGAYLLAAATAGADGTLALALTQKIYTTGTAYTTATNVLIAAPTATALGGAIPVPASVFPSSLGADNSQVIVGSVVATYGAGNPSYSSSYTASQQVIATIIGPGSNTVSQILGSSSGLYDGNGGQGCPCAQSPPVASITGVALDPSGNGVAVGQLTPGGALASASYVVGSATAPLITSVNSTTFTEGTAGTFTVTATGSPAPTFSKTGALPAGVTLTSGGLLSGTPTQSGTFPITITAGNGVAPAATQIFILTADAAPAITSTNHVTFSKGVAGSFTVTAAGFPIPTLAESGSLPSGVTFTPATGTLGGKPTMRGVFHVTFTAHNGIGPDATQSFTLTVPGLFVSTTTLPNGKSGVAYKATSLHAAGGTAPYAWKKLTALPKGLVLSAKGVISGKPAATLAAKSYSFEVQVTDATKPVHETATALVKLTLT
jgi:hypothetical protein